jgi:predicted  nucleic acid-binding Zn-ribbon protein
MADDPVDQIAAQGTAALQAIIDQAEAATTELRTKLAALAAERDGLREQLIAKQTAITALQAQIAEAEGPTVQRARNGLAVVQKALAPPDMRSRMPSPRG